MYARSLFSRFAKSVSVHMGHPTSFAVACALILLWAVLGPIFGFSSGWQLLINTGTTIVTLLMVFLIQNTQNRETAAIQVKLDELIRAVEGAHHALLDLEELTEEELEAIRARYRSLADQAREKLRQGLKDTGPVEVP